MNNTNTLQSVVNDFAEALADKLDQAQHDYFASALREANRNSGRKPIPWEPAPRAPHDIPKHLDTLSKDINDQRFLSAVKNFTWSQTYADSEGIDPGVTEGMFTANVYGSTGVLSAEQFTAGIFLVTPNVYYPLHTHEAAEVYYCLAGSVEITHRFDASPIRLEQEKCSVTPAGRLHALQTREQPVLLAYVWTGNISAPNWWWNKQDDNSWTRTAWQRDSSKGWLPGKTEPVTPTIFEAAMQ